MPYKKFALNVETKDLKRIKVDITSLFLLISFLAVVSVVMMLLGWRVASGIIMIGAFAYSLALVFLFERVSEKKVRKEKLWRIIRSVFLLLTAFMLFVTIQGALFVSEIIHSSDVSQKLYGGISLLILSVSLLGWEKLKLLVKNKLKNSKYLLLVLPVVAFLVISQARITGAASLNETIDTLSTIDNVIQTVSNVTTFISEQHSAITQFLGLNETQSMIATGIIFLIALLLAARFIETIIKWLVLILIGIFLIMLI